MTTMTEFATRPDARFWDRMAKRYARKPVADQAAYETKLAKTDSRLEPTDHLLEIGCGTGTTAIHHAPRVERVHATDISARMIDIAREKADAAGIDNIEFEVADIDDLTAPERPYDVILAHSILHLLADPERVLRQLRRMLKPGGLLISSTACIGDTFPLLRYVAPAGRAVGLLPRVNVFREDDFMQWFSRTGFAIEERWQPKPKSGVYIIARTAGDREAAAG